MEFKEFSEYHNPLEDDYDVTFSKEESPEEETEETDEEYFARVRNYYDNICRGPSYNELYGDKSQKSKGRAR